MLSRKGFKNNEKEKNENKERNNLQASLFFTLVARSHWVARASQ
jgi:hypothetical protein